MGQELPGTIANVERALQSPESSARRRERPPPPSPRACAQGPGQVGEGNPDVQLPGACRAPPSAASRAAGLSSTPGTPLPHPRLRPYNCFLLVLRTPQTALGSPDPGHNTSLKNYKCAPIYSIREPNFDTLSRQLSPILPSFKRLSTSPPPLSL